jgi:hypothetical protein
MMFVKKRSLALSTLMLFLVSILGVMAESGAAGARTINSYEPGAPATAVAPAGSTSTSASTSTPAVSPASSTSTHTTRPQPSRSRGSDVGDDTSGHETAQQEAMVGEGSGAVADGSATAPSSAGDPLVSNGLGSPLCGEGAAAQLSAASERNCQISGFEAAPAPTGNYAFDVHIDTGVLGLNGNGVAATIQDLLLTPTWMGLVWAVHALIVALEWCYTIDLLDSSTMVGAARGLRETQATFTQPWLVVAFTVASVLALYHGIVRRRVAETLGQAALMLAMMAGGLWVIMDPTGTVEAVGQWAGQASLGTLGAVAQGTPEHASRTLADSMGYVFASVVGGPWCYMEFGDVRWCSDPTRMDPRLHAAGLGLAAREQAQVDCRSDTSSLFVSCARAGSEQAQALSESAELLRDARTNGDLFLALPANQTARNSINSSGSLLKVLCGGSADAVNCRGPTAAQAEFRTQSGTWSRFGGLGFIVIGALGMVLLLGFIALHLLGAAITGLFYLLLAPAAVIAPAFGDGGRMVFRGWVTRLLGAVTSKLLFSFLFGVVLAMWRILLGLHALGWWTQWLLVSVLWWGAFRHRHRVLDFAQGGAQRHHSEHHRSIAQRVREALSTPRETLRLAGAAKRKLTRPAPSVGHRQMLTPAAHTRARAHADEQVMRTLEREHADASAHVAAAPDIQARLSREHSQLKRVHGARREAHMAGDARRAAKLGVRAQRIEGTIAREEQRLLGARRLVGEGQRVQRRTGEALPHTTEQREERARFIDAQAALLAGSERGRGGVAAQRRHYAALAGLAGYGRAEYERLDPRRRREARLQIDRELAMRKGLHPMRKELHQVKRSAPDSWLQDARIGASRESPVMRDAREVARRRKRQLGYADPGEKSRGAGRRQSSGPTRHNDR